MADGHQQLRDAASRLADLDDAVHHARHSQRVTRPSPTRRDELEHYLEVPAHLESVVSDSSALLRAGSRAVQGGSDAGDTAQPIAAVADTAARMADALAARDSAADITSVIDDPDDVTGPGPDRGATPARQAVLDLTSSAADRLARLARAIANEPDDD